MIKTEGFSKALKFKNNIAFAFRKWEIGKMTNSEPVEYPVLNYAQEQIIQELKNITKDRQYEYPEINTRVYVK